MNYLHTYHAGSPADVFKHIVLVELLTALKEKEKPFFYLDTHAGSPIYDLTSEPAKRSKEFKKGISKIWNADDLPIIETYLNIVKSSNPNAKLHFYPGSSNIAAHITRS